MRFTMDRSFYIPKGARKISAKGIAADVYVYERESTNGRISHLALAFFGKAKKPTFNFSFNKADRREEYVRGRLEDYRASLAYKAGERAKRTAAGRGLELGDILRASWGYDMTIVDYYEVTKLIGKTMVEIRKIGADKTGGGFSGKSFPCPGEYIGEPERKIAKDGAISMTSYSSAYLLEPEITAGAKVYAGSYYNSLD